MKTRLWISLLICLLLPASSMACPCGGADEHRIRQTAMNEIFERYRTLGACVVILQNGEVEDVFCYGQRDPGGEDITPNTLFRVASISKMITAIGVLQLWEQGLVTMDGDLSDIFGFSVRSPYAPSLPVTLRQVMSHTAGLRDSGHYTLALRGKTSALRDLFAGDSARYLFYSSVTPGSKSVYSNFGGGLLGCLIECISGQTLDSYMREHVFSPLGLTAAYSAALLPADAALANLYIMPQKWLSQKLSEDAPPSQTPDFERDYDLSAGKLIISAPDLAKLLIALCDGGIYHNVRILSESAVKEQQTPQNNLGSVSCQSGRGLCMNILTDEQVQGRTLYGHGGKASGMLCAAYFDPADRSGVVMLTNGCNNRPMRNGVGLLGREILQLGYDRFFGDSYCAESPFLVR